MHCLGRGFGGKKVGDVGHLFNEDCLWELLIPFAGGNSMALQVWTLLLFGTPLHGQAPVDLEACVVGPSTAAMSSHSHAPLSLPYT